MKQQIQIAAKLYECRDTARRLAGESYKLRLADWKQAVQDIAAAYSLDYLHAGMKLANSFAVKHDGMGMMWAMAATVELIEPDEEKETVSK